MKLRASDCDTVWKEGEFGKYRSARSESIESMLEARHAGQTPDTIQITASTIIPSGTFNWHSELRNRTSF